VFGVITPATAQQVIYVVRHAEQAGMEYDAPLTEVGQRRADALGEILDRAGITAIYTSELLRTRQTAQPLADALGFTVEQVAHTDTNGLVAKVSQEGPNGRVLIVAHTQTIPVILRAFGLPNEVTIDMSDYDNLFLVVRNAPSQPVLVRLRFTLPAKAG
jgi:broad specificity phosphatase PhoE